MTAQFNTTINNILASSTTKTGWCAAFEAAFNGSLVVRMFRDNANNVVDPSATGVEFFNASVTGAFTVTAGNISSFGNISSINIKQTANLLTGTSMLVLEGNGARATFSLGLTRGKQSALGVASVDLKDFDYALFEQPSSSGGMGFVNGTGINAPIFLNTGIGPGAPSTFSDEVVAYQMFSYPTDDTEANRVGLGIHYINVREPNLAFNQAFVATQIGDVRYMREAAGAGTIFGTGGDCFRFAPTSLVFDKSLNADDSTKPVQRIRFLATPHGRWYNYPYLGGLNLSTDTISPQAFKIELYSADMTVKDVIEMYSSRVNNVPGSGKPVNNRTQQMEAQFQQAGSVKKVQPWWTCQMSLSYDSANIKPSKYLNHLHPGVVATSLDETHVKWFDSGPDQWPIITGNYLTNGLHSIRVSPKWARDQSTGCDTTTLDPVFVNILRDNGVTQMVGHGYEPGSTGQHTWFMGPGGSRHDRAMWPHYTVAWLTNSSGIRVHGSVPYREMQKDWLLNYHNEGCHYPTNPELGTTLNKADVMGSTICYQDTYYGDNTFRPDMPNHAVRLLASGNQVHNSTIRDKNGRIMTGEYTRDVQHNISNAAQMTYFGNDPMGAFEARDSFNSAILATWDLAPNFPIGSYMAREHAWFFKHLVEMWAIGNNHRNGMSSAEMEFLALRHLHTVADLVDGYLATASTNMQARGMRDLGLYCEKYTSSDGLSASLGVYDSKAFYFANILMLAKQCGFIDRMRSLSSKASHAIDLIVNSLCKASVDFFLDADGRPDKQYNQFIPFTVASPPAVFSWSAYPTNGQQNWVLNQDGVLANANGDGTYIEGYNTQHFRAQFLWVLKNFLTEYNFPRMDAAITKVQGWYDMVEAQKQAGGQNWHYMFAPLARPKAPAIVGKPVIS